MAPRHAAQAAPRRRARLVVGAVIILALAAAAVAVALVPTTITAPSAGAANVAPLHVRALAPSGQNVSPDAPLRVVFNEPLAASSPMPTITPSVAGNWAHLSADELSFRASAPFAPGRTYVLTVPSTTTSLGGAALRVTVARRFTIATGSMLRLNQVLAQLGYFPLRFVPTGPFHATSAAVQRGTFTWRWRDVPAQLTALWQPSVYTVITKGAIMAFENDHNLPTDGIASPQIWTDLLHAVATRDVDKATYNYVDVSTDIPETLTLYVGGATGLTPIYHTLVNTGISARPTALETNPVYLRYTVTTMTGTNPDGSHYSDPGIPWVSYFNDGEALHGFIRSSYGWPQSLGCVEMPFANAQVVFPYTPIGTLVTVY